MVSLSLRIRVRSDSARAAAEVEAVPPRLDAAMRRGTERGTNLLAASVARLVESRTSMDASVARAITKAEVLPGGGPISRGQVSFTKPPARIYPKKGKALAFTIGGVKLVRRSVKGSRPYALIQRTADDRTVVQAIGEVYRKEVEGSI